MIIMNYHFSFFPKEPSHVLSDATAKRKSDEEEGDGDEREHPLHTGHHLGVITHNFRTGACFVGLCVVVYGCVWLCAVLCASVCFCVVLYGSVWLCVVPCCLVWLVIFFSVSETFVVCVLET